MESCGHWWFNLHPKFGQILTRQQPSMSLVIAYQGVGDLPLIKLFTGGIQRRRPPGKAPRVFGSYHQAERATEVFLIEPFALLRRAPAGEKNGCRTVPLGIFTSMLRDDLAHQAMRRIAILAQGNRAFRDVGKAHRAILVEGSDPGSWGRRNHGAEEARGDFTATVLLEIFSAGATGPASQAADGGDLLAVSVIKNDRGHPGDADHVRIQHA